MLTSSDSRQSQKVFCSSPHPNTDDSQVLLKLPLSCFSIDIGDNGSPSLRKFEEYILKKLSIGLQLDYRDSAGDLLQLCSDDHLEDALKNVPSTGLKIKVSLLSSPPNDDVAETREQEEEEIGEQDDTTLLIHNCHAKMNWSSN